MKRGLIVAVTVCCLPVIAMAQGFTPDHTYWEWLYAPDSTVATTRAIDNDDIANNPSSVMGYEEVWWEVAQEVNPDSCIDSVQFTLWGWRLGLAADSLGYFDYTPDSSILDYPAHESFGTADSLWMYDNLYWKANWLRHGTAADTTVWGAQNVTSPRYRVRIYGRKK